MLDYKVTLSKEANSLASLILPRINLASGLRCKYLVYAGRLLPFQESYCIKQYSVGTPPSYKRSIVMKVMIPLLLFSVAALTTGCISHNANTSSAPLQVNLVSNELKADVVVGEKISGQAKITYFFGIPFGSTNKYADGVFYDGMIVDKSGWLASVMSLLGSVNEAKASAAYDAISKSNADVIISPRYTMDIQDFWIFKNVEAQVTGYKGTIKSIQ